MELIRKSDALHAVLHNTGDAAVAAVQAIEPVLFTELQGTKVKMPEIRTQTLDEYKNPHGELREMLIDEMIDKGEWLDEQRGRWIYAKCNLCGKVQDVRSNYCPNCGARMRNVTDCHALEEGER